MTGYYNGARVPRYLHNETEVVLSDGIIKDGCFNL